MSAYRFEYGRMKRPPIFDNLGSLFLVSLTLQYTFAQTQQDSFITSLNWHALPLALLARPLTQTHTAIPAQNQQK